LAVFWSVKDHAFINLDDQVYVTENWHVQAGLTWSNVEWAVTNLEAGFWHPLTWLSIMLDCQLFGLRAGGHHLTSLLLHTANTVLLFLVFWRMTAALWRSAFVAGIFALHPLHVEPVAWAADRKDVLSTLFWMLTLWAYVAYARSQARTVNQGSNTRRGIGIHSKWIWYVTSLIFFTLGLMSKSMIVTLPLILLLLDWWPLHRLPGLMPSARYAALKRLVLEKLPFFAMSLGAGLLTIHAEHSLGALASVTRVPIGFRLANASVSYWRYLAQTFWPTHLAVFYPYPDGISPWSVALAAVLLAAVSVWFFSPSACRKKPWLAVGWLWYLVTLLPVIGLIQVGSHSHADRYTYVPLMGVFLIVTWGIHDLISRRRGGMVALSTIGLAAILLCAMLATKQIGYWKDSETLFRHVIEVTKNNYLAYHCLGVAVSAQGRADEAMAHYEAALQINPAYGEAHNNLGIELATRGKIDEAMIHFRDAVRFSPGLASAHSNLGMALASRGHLREAVKEYEESLRLKPDNPQVHSNLGNALDEQGRTQEAIAQYVEALRLEPNSAEIHVNLGMTLARIGKHDEAIAHFNEALRIKPDYLPAQRQLQAISAPAVKP
jgi:Tfp pilus assembly protein PilF